MSREIKFRAWDKKNKSFIPDDNEFKEYMIGLDGKFYRMDFYSGVSGHEDGNLIWNELEDIVLMQDTGLLDKNGKKIFEGDIVKFDSINYEIIYSTYHACFMFQHKHYSGEVFRHFFHEKEAGNWKNTEIIGNIYEGVKNV